MVGRDARSVNRRHSRYHAKRMTDSSNTAFENVVPILRVEDMVAALHFYVDLLGFTKAPWGNDDFTQVSRDSSCIYLARGDQGQGHAWAWVGVSDVEPLYQYCLAKGITIRLPPTNFSWALEMRIEDPDGNVLRMGSDPK